MGSSAKLLDDDDSFCDERGGKAASVKSSPPRITRGSSSSSSATQVSGSQHPAVQRALDRLSTRMNALVAEALREIELVARADPPPAPPRAARPLQQPPPPRRQNSSFKLGNDLNGGTTGTPSMTKKDKSAGRRASWEEEQQQGVARRASLMNPRERTLEVAGEAHSFYRQPPNRQPGGENSEGKNQGAGGANVLETVAARAKVATVSSVCAQEPTPPQLQPPQLQKRWQLVRNVVRAQRAFCDTTAAPSGRPPTLFSRNRSVRDQISPRSSRPPPAQSQSGPSFLKRQGSSHSHAAAGGVAQPERRMGMIKPRRMSYFAGASADDDSQDEAVAGASACSALHEAQMRQARLRMQGHDPDLMKALFGLDADSLLWVEDPEAHRGGALWYILHPLTWKRLAWDLMMAALIAFTTIETPFAIAFLDYETHSVHRALNYSIDSIMLCDVALSFFSGYVDEDEQIVLNHRRIVKHYTRGWFLLELLTSLPVHDVTPITRTAFRSLRLLRLFRLLRLHRLTRRLTSWQEDATWSLTALRLLKLLFGVFTYAHLNACFQFGVPSVNGFPADSWVFMANLPIDQLPATDAVIECYTVAFFQAISNALCTGYGVTTPSRVDELWTMLLSMVIGACLYAVALAFACNVLQNVDHGSRRYQNLLAEANELMRVRCFPKSLRDRVRRLLEIQYPNRRAFSADLLREVSTPMRHEIRMTQCASLFRLTPLFQGADPAFLSAMAGALEVEYAQPGDWLTREHEATRCVFFVQQGRVEVLIDAKPVAELVEGSYIGEIAALGLGNEAGSEDEAGENDGEDAWHDASGADDDPLACAATASVRAIEVTTLFVVGRQRFRAIVSHYPAMRKAMQVVARLRYARGAAAVDGSGVVPSLRTARKQVMVDQASRARWQAISELRGEDVEAYVEAQRLHAIEEQKEKERERLSQACAEEEKRQATHCRYSMFDSASEGCGRKSVAGAGGEVEQLEGAGAKGHRSRSSCVRRLSNPFTSLGPGLNLGQGRRNGGGAALPSAAGRPRDSGGSSADSTAPAPAMNWRANVLGQQNGGRRLSVTDIRRASIAPARKR